MVLAIDLTEEKQDLFKETFYSLWEENFSFSRDDEGENPCPWGYPWFHGSKIELEGDTVEKMARNFFEDHKEEIQACLEEEQQ